MPRPEGPFERLLRQRPQRDPAPLIIGGTIAFLAIVIVLVFVFSSLLGGGSNTPSGNGVVNGEAGSCADIAQDVKSCRATLPALPPGLTAVSRFFEFQIDKPGVGATISLPLLEATTDDKGLGFYTYSANRWQRVDIVALQGSGSLAQGTFSPLPSNLAVLRVAPATYIVGASLPHGTTVHGDAGQLQIVSPRDYTPTADGTIQGTPTDVGHPQGTLVIPTIVGSGTDTASVIDDILNDENLRAKHVTQISGLVQQNGLDGIDLEYSSVNVDEGAKFTLFVTALAAELHRTNKRLILTLPPPTNQRSPYEFDKLGSQADYIKVLPIADPVAYWETMPTAIGQIVAKVDPHKVLLVVSPYSIQGTGDVSQPIGYQQAMVLASEPLVHEPPVDQIKPNNPVSLVAKNQDESEGATPMAWNDDALTVSFALGGTERKRIYIENSYSVSFKLELVEAYALGGVSVADGSAQSDVANIWPTVKSLIDSATVTLVKPNDSMLNVIFQADDNNIQQDAGATAATWLPRAAGDHLVSLVASDGERLFSQQLMLTVGQGGPTPTTSPISSFGPTPTETPTPEPTESPIASATPTPVLGAVRVEVGLLAEGDDDNFAYSNDEKVTPGSTVTYLVTIDNDTDAPVTVTSFTDNTYGDAVCKTSGGEDVIGGVVGADDGDAALGAGHIDGGVDEIQCIYTEKAPDTNNLVVTNEVTASAEDDGGHSASDHDDTTIRTTTG
ncbi:MAG: glycosyl hydrolase family 18 protein [Chloroflexota bacterium]